MAKYKVKGNLEHNGEPYGKGGTIELDDKHAQPLLDVNVIELIREVDEDTEKKKAAAEKKKAAAKKTDDPKKDDQDDKEVETEKK